MKKIVLVFGLIAGTIVSIAMLIGVALCKDTMAFDKAMLIGFASMFLAFTLIFIGIKTFRDKHNGGIISFSKAFTMGFYMTLIASTMYVVSWMIDYHFFVPDFMDRYSNHVIEAAKNSGAAQVDIDKQVADMAIMKERYANPIYRILYTYLEILPLGLLFTLISALILKRKQRPADMQWETNSPSI